MRAILLSVCLCASGSVLACANTREVPLTPEREGQYQKQREEVRRSVEKARRAKNQVDLDLAKADLARIDQILGSRRELVVIGPGTKAPSSKCAG